MPKKISEDMMDPNFVKKVNDTVEYLDDVSINIKKFGVVGDGIIDDTNALQAAFDYSSIHKAKVFNGDKNAVFRITSPLYIQSHANIDLGHAEIRKVNNKKGEGSNLFFTAEGIIDYYTVDAHMIIKHQDNEYAENVKIKNVYFGSKHTNQWHEYGIFAPRLTNSEMDSIKGEAYKFNTLVKGFTWWLIPTLDNLRQDGGFCVFHLDDDGSGAGGSTSIHSKQIVGTDMKNCLKIFGLSYSVFDVPLVDYSREEAFYIESSESLIFNSPSAEWLNSGEFLVMTNSKVVINSPRATEIKGSDIKETYLLSIDNGSSLVMNGGIFKDYISGNYAVNLPLVVNNDSHVTLNQTILPSNGNLYNPLTGGSTVTEINSNGISVKNSEGKGIIINGRKIFFESDIPTSGEYALGDVVINLSPQKHGVGSWVCLEAGSPGKWGVLSIIKSEKSGTSYLSGNSIQKTYSIPHGLGEVPNVAFVQPSNAVAGEAKINYITYNEKNLIINFLNAPKTGTNNVKVHWKVEG
ncbi:hypothetical protein [Bacillus sp. REN10]|uniref:hypothetical protein n=1 Tax=Bacillus sp. REN10 TaxID=2782541 RepID=UPI00193B6157|nr:hypothetical protein [Bacillus sp. REN10]